MIATVGGIDDVARAALQRRVLRVLTGGQIVGAAALGTAVTVGAFVVQDILGDETPWGGIATATVTTGTAVMAQALSRLMLRRGQATGVAARLRHRRRRRRDRRGRRRTSAARRVRRRAVPVRQRPGVQPARPLRRHRSRRARAARSGDEPGRVRLDVRGGVRTAAHRPCRARRRGVVRVRPLHRTVAVRRPVLPAGDDQHGGASAPRPARRRRRRGDGRRARRARRSATPCTSSAPRRGPAWRCRRWPSHRRRWSP